MIPQCERLARDIRKLRARRSHYLDHFYLGVLQDDFEVQLGELSFLQQQRELSLAEVPPVLLSMVWSEIQTISGEGKR